MYRTLAKPVARTLRGVPPSGAFPAPAVQAAGQAPAVAVAELLPPKSGAADNGRTNTGTSADPAAPYCRTAAPCGTAAWCTSTSS
eukprot:366529-Chlamydomonas_euryale.AAC.20